MKLRTLRVDGGAVGNDLLMQFQSDMLDVTVERPSVNESTALGAAYLAGLAVGFWSGREEIRSLRRTDRAFEPNMAEARRRELYEGWQRAVQAAMAFKRTV